MKELKQTFTLFSKHFMVSSTQNIKPKKYKTQSLTGQKGVNLIERIVLDMGFVWNPTHFEAGIDGVIEIRDSKTEDATNFIIQVQSKATEHPFTAETENTFEYLCDERDLDYWLKGNCPVIIICSNVIDNKAYWVSIKDYFKETTKRKSRKIIFNKKINSFSATAKDELFKIGVPESSGYYLSPPPIREQIYSNLLQLKTFPDKIYEAKTKYRKRKELWNALNQIESKTGINKSWVLYDEKIYSFNDLSKAPWLNFITGKENAVKSFSTTNWSNTHDLDLKNRFIQLLNNSFETYAHHKNILHKTVDKIDLYYFRPTLDQQGLPATKKFSYDRLGRNSGQTVCDRYARKSDPSIISYYRHLAFEIQFLRFDNTWYLELTPTYFFTHDGFKLHMYYESKLKGKKGLDKAEIVFSETLFWADILRRGTNDMFSRSILTFDFPYNSDFEVGINDALWLEKEDDDKKQILSNQLSLFENET